MPFVVPSYQPSQGDLLQTILRGTCLNCPADSEATSEYRASQQVTKPLSDSILQQNPQYSFDTLEAQLVAKSNLRTLKKQVQSNEASNLKSCLPVPLQYSMSLAQESGASNWLTALPIEDFGLTLHKGAFQRSFAVRSQGRAWGRGYRRTAAPLCSTVYTLLTIPWLRYHIFCVQVFAMN